MDYRAQAKQIAGRYGVPEGIFDALIAGESGWNPWAVGAAGEIGLSQLMPGTALELGVNPWNPTQNMEGAAAYLSRHYKEYGDWRSALAAYKGGPANRSTPGALSAADKVLKAAGIEPIEPIAGVVSPEESAFRDPSEVRDALNEQGATWSWSDPWPWLKARSADLVCFAAGLLCVVAGLFMLVNAGSGGALGQGFASGARQGAREALA